MDQVKVYLEVLKKYHFWVITGFLLIIGILGWKMGVGALETEFTSNRGQIQGAFQAAGGVMGVNPHPNSEFTEAVNKEHTRVKNEALNAWQLLYNRQQQLLNWSPDVLTDVQINEVKNLEPGGTLSTLFLDTYEARANTIPQSWIEKYDLMREVPSEDEEGEPTIAGVVIWGGRSALEDRYRWGRTPQTYEVLMAQEDLWVYEALLKIVAATNNGVTEHYNAPVRQIIELDIAQDALAGAPEVDIENVQQSSGGLGGTQKITPPTKGATEQALLDGRYVDEVSGQPLPSGPTPNSVYRLIPIRMKLLMDQRYITQLCVACGNSPLMVEPRQVLFVDEDAEGGGKGGKNDSGLPLQSGPNACYVDLRGVMYLLNPPDTERLQTAEDGAAPLAATGNSSPGA